MAHEGNSSCYPLELLFGISWTFRGSEFQNQAVFDAAVTEFQDPKFRDVWRPKEVVLLAAHIRVSPDVAWYLTDEHPTIEFGADNGHSFTAGELLYKVHNAFVANLRQMDHQYFEGFTLDENQEPSKPPLYNLDLGS